MRKFYTTAIAVGLGALMTASLAQPALGGSMVFTKSFDINHHPNIFDVSSFDLDLTFGNKVFNPTNGVTLFDSLVISPADVGQTFRATAVNDPNFAAGVARLTDGLNEFVKIMLTEDKLSGRSEQRGWQENLFLSHFDTTMPPDLSGVQVTMVALHIDNFSIAMAAPSGSPAISASTAATGPEFQLDFTLEIFTVPEPTAWILALAGLVCYARKAAARKRATP